jgi:hypothetical protein
VKNTSGASAAARKADLQKPQQRRKRRTSHWLVGAATNVEKKKNEREADTWLERSPQGQTCSNSHTRLLVPSITQAQAFGKEKPEWKMFDRKIFT